MELAILTGIGLLGNLFNKPKIEENKNDKIYNTDFINENKNYLAEKYKNEQKKEDPNIIPSYYNLKNAGILTSSNSSKSEYGTQTNVINTKLDYGNIKQNVN